MNNLLKKRIMKKVYTIWFVRYFAKNVIVKSLVLAGLVFIFKEAVFVSAVVDNAVIASNNLSSFTAYAVDAVFHAGLLNLSVTVSAAVLLLFLAKDFARISSRLLSAATNKAI